MIVDLGDIRFDDIKNTEYYDLYSLLPLVDRAKRQREGIR